MTYTQLIITLLPWAVIGWTVGNAIGWIDMNTSENLSLPTKIWHWVWYRWKSILGIWLVTFLIMYFAA